MFLECSLSTIGSWLIMFRLIQSLQIAGIFMGSSTDPSHCKPYFITACVGRKTTISVAFRKLSNFLSLARKKSISYQYITPVAMFSLKFHDSVCKNVSLELLI